MNKPSMKRSDNNVEKNINLVKDFYRVFDTKSIALLDDIYASDVVFLDPFHRIEGISNLKDYFNNLAQNINYCRFEFKQHAINGSDVFLQWVMVYSHPKIQKGKELELNGVSHIVINEKITFHRDYFDSSEMLYKHIPVLGSVIRLIEKNMGNRDE